MMELSVGVGDLDCGQMIFNAMEERGKNESVMVSYVGNMMVLV
jgi:hypothetical protein